MQENKGHPQGTVQKKGEADPAERGEERAEMRRSCWHRDGGRMKSRKAEDSERQAGGGDEAS